MDRVPTEEERLMPDKNVPQATAYDEIIREHYAQEARIHGTSPTSTMADECVRTKETEAIIGSVKSFIREQTAAHATNGGYAEGPGRDGGFHIVDLGCGNGLTVQELAVKIIPGPLRLSFTGVEFNADLRAIAQERLRAFGNVKVAAGDVRTIDASQCEPADVVILQRVLINLLDRADQKRALDNIVGLLNPGGLLFAIEAFESGLAELNSAREECGLSPLPPAHHNLYLTDDFFDHPLLARHMSNESIETSENLLSTHYFVSRVLHPAFLNATGRAFKRNSHFVKFMSAALPDGIGAYSPLKIIIRRKKSLAQRGFETTDAS
jgi:SAM-dependent methyltransferase